MIFFFLILGIILGSFVNALVWRLHLRTQKKLNDPNSSIFTGRSMCPDCRHILKPIDLIPIVSWISLKGKCRYCHKPISIQYPIIEITSGILFYLSYIYWPLNFNSWGYLLLSIWLIILVTLISLALYDLKYKILPDKIVYITLVLSVIFVIINYLNFNHTTAYIIARILGVVFSSGIFYLIFMVSGGRWIGGGDVKLCFSLGLLIGGPLEAILMIFIASVAGSLATLIIFILGKFKSNMTIPFGPLLILGACICFFFGPQMINWYTSIT